MRWLGPGVRAGPLCASSASGFPCAKLPPHMCTGWQDGAEGDDAQAVGIARAKGWPLERKIGREQVLSLSLYIYVYKYIHLPPQPPSAPLCSSILATNTNTPKEQLQGAQGFEGLRRHCPLTQPCPACSLGPAAAHAALWAAPAAGAAAPRCNQHDRAQQGG